MITTLKTETRFLEQIHASQLVGICFLDSERKLVQVFSNDPLLKQMILEYQAQRVRELELSEDTVIHKGESVPYPTLSE